MKKQKEVRTLSELLNGTPEEIAKERRIATFEADLYQNGDSEVVDGMKTMLADFIMANRGDVNAKVVLAKSLLVELAMQEYKSR